MRKQSFLSLSVILLLFLSSCTKEDLPDYNPSTPAGYYSAEPTVISYSNWTTDASLTWSDGATADPSRQFDVSAPELTEELLAEGSFVLIYAKSNVDGSVKSMPAEYTDLNNNETNIYSASYTAGTISLWHTKSVNGVFETPNDSNEISFRYIVVKPATPDPNGRVLTSDDFYNKPYSEVISLLGIPE